MTVYDGLKFEAKNSLEWVVVGLDKNMTTINIPESFGNRKVTGIRECAFKDNKTIEAVNFSKFINTIGWSAFEGCKNLKYLFFDQSYEKTTIGTRAFYNCELLTGFTCLKPVILDKESFEGCANLRSVDGMIYSLHDYAFCNCGMLHTVNLHSKVFISPHVFDGCQRLDNIYIVKDVDGSLEFIKNLPPVTTVHCYPDSRVADLVYEGYKVVANLR